MHNFETHLNDDKGNIDFFVLFIIWGKHGKRQLNRNFVVILIFFKFKFSEIYNKITMSINTRCIFAAPVPKFRIIEM